MTPQIHQIFHLSLETCSNFIRSEAFDSFLLRFWWLTNDMSTTHCETNIVRIRVGLFNDILRFDYVLLLFFLHNIKTWVNWSTLTIFIVMCFCIGHSLLFVCQKSTICYQYIWHYLIVILTKNEKKKREKLKLKIKLKLKKKNTKEKKKIKKRKK